MKTIEVHSFYQFTPLEPQKLELHKKNISAFAEQLNVRGLVVMGTEGINTTLSGSKSDLVTFCTKVQKELSLIPLEIKVCPAEKHPFKRFNVKIRDEIVTLQRKDIIPKATGMGPGKGHISPKEWDKKMAQPETVVIDTRNTYEVEIGRFKNAVDMNISEFSEFPEKVNQKNWDKNKEYLIYCTGGIRCEKAIYSMEEQGFKNVYQLDGGIINYLKERPQKNYQGECFVFDSRVAVDQNLNPTTDYSLCPHCGDVSKVHIVCVKCETEAMVCPQCYEQSSQDTKFLTCSKNCAYHFKRDPDSKSVRQERHYHDS